MAVALPAEVAAIIPAVSNEMSGGIFGREAPGDTVTTQIATVAVRVCYDYASAAPIEVLQLAAGRLGGWLLGRQPHVTSRRTKTPDGTELELVYRMAGTSNALRESGASSLLSPYKVRHAGLIG